MATAWSYNQTDYLANLKKAGASIPPAATPKPMGAIPQAAAKPPVTPMAAQPKPAGAIPQMASSAPAPGSHESHQAYINKSTPGGLSAYQATQQGRYNDAYAKGDQDLISKLNADVQRVGYSLQIPQMAQPQAAQPPAQPMAAQPQYAIPPAATPDAVTNVRSSSELQAQSGDSLAIERAALDTAVRERLTSLKNGAEYSNKLLQDNRVLENAQMERTLNPFSGRTSYDKAMVNRGRGIDDSARAADLANKLGATQEELYNFDKLAPERKRQIYEQSLKAEREFGLNVGQLTGNFGGQRTLAGQAQDWGRTVDEANLTGMYGGQKTAAQSNTEWGQRFDYGQATGTFGNGQQTLENKKFQYTQGRDKVADGQWQKEFSRRAEQDGIQNAISWANNSLSADDNARQWADLDYKMSNGQTPDYNGMSANQVMDAVKGKLFDADGVLKPNTDKETIYRSVVEYGLPDGQDDQVLLSFGLTKEDIQALDKKLGLNSGN